MYADRISAQYCMRAAANGGNALLGPKMEVRGLWSVNRVNYCVQAVVKFSP